MNTLALIKPEIAECIIVYEDDPETPLSVLIQLSFDGIDNDTESDIFFFCNGEHSLIDMLKDGYGCDGWKLISYSLGEESCCWCPQPEDL
jgi:hypothetical protein